MDSKNKKLITIAASVAGVALLIGLFFLFRNASGIKNEQLIKDVVADCLDSAIEENGSVLLSSGDITKLTDSVASELKKTIDSEDFDVATLSDDQVETIINQLKDSVVSEGVISKEDSEKTLTEDTVRKMIEEAGIIKYINKQGDTATLEQVKELESQLQKLKEENLMLEDTIDGLNSLSGINGIDGRAGLDGKDGKNGVNGKDGAAGKDGKDGKDGISEKGEKGDKGETGDRGNTGLRGEQGIDGICTFIFYADDDHGTNLSMTPTPTTMFMQSANGRNADEAKEKLTSDGWVLFKDTTIGYDEESNTLLIFGGVPNTNPDGI